MNLVLFSLGMVLCADAAKYNPRKVEINMENGSSAFEEQPGETNTPHPSREIEENLEFNGLWCYKDLSSGWVSHCLVRISTISDAHP